eukprot:Opistho-2@79762
MFEWIASDVKKSVPASKYVCVTDQVVAPLYLDRLVAAFQAVGILLHTKIIPPGEPHKNRATKESIEDWMLTVQCNRDTCVVALGGGVVGDLTGFVAATYLRGVPFVQIPTTLLAMVDSSIGGKTGLDTVHGKNLIGSFHQPAAIYMDLDILATLPERQFSNGMAEVIKTAAIWDADYFDFLDNNADAIMEREPALLQRMVTRSAEIKAEVVTQDEKEDCVRC